LALWPTKSLTLDKGELTVASTKTRKQKELEALFDLLVAGLTAKMAANEATAADYQVVRQLLKDSNFEFDRENPPEKIKELIDNLPELGDDPSWEGLPN